MTAIPAARSLSMFASRASQAQTESFSVAVDFERLFERFTGALCLFETHPRERRNLPTWKALAAGDVHPPEAGEPGQLSRVQISSKGFVPSQAQATPVKSSITNATARPRILV